MNRINYLLKNIGILTLSNFASKILVFLLVPIYTSVLSTGQVGIYDLVISTVSLLFPILTMNIVDAMMRFLMDKSQPENEVALIGLRYVVSSFFPVLLFLIIASKINGLSAIHGYEIYIFFYYMFSCINQYMIQFSKGIEQVSAMGIAGVLGTVTMLTANIVLLLGLKAGLTGFFIANIIGQAIPAIYLFFRTKLWTYLNTRIKTYTLQKEMLSYCIPLIATAVGWWINSTSDKYVVTLICGVAANGILSVSYKIPVVINTLQSIFIQAWQITAVKEYGGNGTDTFYGKTFSILNMLMAITCACLICLTKPIGSILYKNEFFVAWQYVPFLLIASVLNSASGFLGPILSAKKASKPMAMSAVYGAAANLLLNIILVYLIGIQGATIATVISSFIIYLVRKQAVGDDIRLNGYKVILVTWGLLCIQAIFEIYTSLWWIEIILLAMIITINFKDVKEIFRLTRKIIKR